MMTLSVLGADSEFDVRRRMEWSFTWPVNLQIASEPVVRTEKKGWDSRDVHEKLLVRIACELRLVA